MRIKTAAVIGGGIAGLAAARWLCLNDYSVTVYEASGKTGGCCGVTRIGGYSFSDGAAFVAVPTVLDRLFEILQLDRPSRLPLRRIAPVQMTVLPDGRAVRFGGTPPISVTSPAGTVATIPDEQVNAFVEEWAPLLQSFTEILAAPFSCTRWATVLASHFRVLSRRPVPSWNRSFSNDAVRAALSGGLIYVGTPTSRISIVGLLSLVAMFRFGYFLPRGGMGRIPEVLTQAVIEAGGTIRVNTRVRRVLVRGGRLCGLQLDTNDFVDADAVIVTSSALHTYQSLMAEEDLTFSLRRKLHHAKLSDTGFSVQLGLGNRIALDAYSNNWLAMGTEPSDEMTALMRPGSWPIYLVPTVAAPELAPPGGSIVEVFVQVSQGANPRHWTEEGKGALAARAIERLRQHCELDVQVRRLVSPTDFESDLHLYRGAIYGLSPSINPGRLFSHHTPIRGLYQAGQTTWPGVGVGSAGLSGVFAAQRLAREAAR